MMWLAILETVYDHQVLRTVLSYEASKPHSFPVASPLRLRDLSSHVVLEWD